MSKPVIYHNPRCSKSRQTLALLEEKNLDVNIVEYLQSPLSADDLNSILTQLGGDVRAMVRKKEAAYQEQGLSEESSTDDIIAAIVQEPILLERPIVVHQGKAAIGRPPENVLQLFE